MNGLARFLRWLKFFPIGDVLLRKDPPFLNFSLSQARKDPPHVVKPSKRVSSLRFFLHLGEGLGRDLQRGAAFAQAQRIARLWGRARDAVQ